MAEYEEQYRRMIRWLEKIEEMAEPGEGEINLVDLKDFFIAYFQNCYHLRDYLQNDSKTSICESDTQSFIDNNDCMGLCGDICNATKHLNLDSSGFSGEDPELSAGAHVTENPAKGVASATYIVEMDSDEIDAYQLAKDCKNKWDEFLQSKELVIPK